MDKEQKQIYRETKTAKVQKERGQKYPYFDQSECKTKRRHFEISKLKRNQKVNDYMHKASRKIVNACIRENINTIVIGYNKGWKRSTKLNKNVNQSFAGLPTQWFIEMIQYKAQEVRIRVILTEEPYTSGTSFLDGEEPVKKNYDKSRRVHRGLFLSSNGIEINADINASYQILKKVFPTAYVNGIEDVVLHPVRVNAAFI